MRKTDIQIDPTLDARRLDWLDKVGDLEDIRGYMINEYASLREAIDHFMKQTGTV